MNFTASSLSIRWLLASSPFLSPSIGSRSSVEITKSALSDSASAFYISGSAHQLGVRFCNFDRFLADCIRVSSYSQQNITSVISLASSGTISITDCMFSNFTGFSAVVSVSSVSSNIYVLRSGFSKCQSSSAYAVFSSYPVNTTVVTYCCFKNTIAGDAAAYRADSHSTTVNYATMNFTLEYLSSSSPRGSWFGGLTSFAFYNNNATSNSITTYRCGFCFVISPTNTEVSGFSQATSCSGATIVAFWPGSLTQIHNHLNFVNNSVTSSWIEIGMAGTVYLYDSAFVGNSAVSWASYYSSAYSMTVTLGGCVYTGTLPGATANVITGNLSIGSSLNNVPTFMSRNCWNLGANSFTFTSIREIYSKGSSLFKLACSVVIFTDI